MPDALTGTERFHSSRLHPDRTVLDFWRWADSDLMSNALRGRLAEYIVACALEIDDHLRQEWFKYDLLVPPDLSIEVKSASYVQAWKQDGPSKIIFGIQPTRGWDPDTAVYESEMKRHARVYVFALLGRQDSKKVDPLNLDEWRFFVMPASTLNARFRGQKTLGLSVLSGCCPAAVDFGGLRSAVTVAGLSQD